jgi:hypothetical protein
MTIDISKINVGDTITINGIVTEIDSRDTEMPVEIDGYGWVYAHQIVAHTPRKIQPGDFVRLKNGSHRYSVIAANDGYVWIKSSDSSCGTLVLEDEVVIDAR